MIVTESVKHPTATENVVQKSLMNSCSDTHTPISDQDYNMTRGTVILRSPPKNSRIQLRKTKKSIGEVNSSAPHKQNLQATTPQT